MVSTIGLRPMGVGVDVTAGVSGVSMPGDGSEDRAGDGVERKELEATAADVGVGARVGAAEVVVPVRLFLALAADERQQLEGAAQLVSERHGVRLARW
jgi:hypothetical protein